MANQEQVQKTAQRPARARVERQADQDQRDVSAARQWVRRDIADLWWPEGS